MLDVLERKSVRSDGNGLVQRRHGEYIGRRMMRSELQGKRKAKDEIYGCSDRGHEVSWCERCKG